VPFFITPFLHLGDPFDPNDPTRRGYTSPALAWLLREADGVFVQTPGEQVAAIELGVTPERVTLQGLGVTPAECTGGDRFAARERWGLPPDAFVVGHLANLSWEKGSNDLLAAFELLCRTGREIHLLLAGPEMPNFTDRVAHSARRLGPLTDAERRDFYAAIDAFALPSRSDSFGLVLLEAWANGVPNVGYRAGGIADVIRHNVDGLLVPCGDIAGLADAIRRLHDDEPLRARLGAAGRQRLPHDFDWEDKLALVRRTIASRVAGNPGKTDELSVHEPADVVD
jgi:glycosyltransferase involved in cell wall biosynthesis